MAYPNDTAGLSSLDQADQEAALESQQGFLAKPAQSKGITPAGSIAVDPKQTAELLANMQSMIDERSGAFNTFLGGLKDASAWGSGGVNGPTQALAVREAEKNKDYNDILAAREKMASLRSAQTTAENFAKQKAADLGGGTGGGGAGGAGAPGSSFGTIAGLPKLAQDALASARTPEEYNKMKARFAELSMNPEWSKPTEYVDANGNLNKAPLYIASAQADPNNARNASIFGKATTSADPLAAIQRGVFSQESGSGKADTSKPNYAGAIGPMQMLPETFEGLKKEGLIPKDYDIKNPEQNKAAGNKLLEKYYKQYNGDVDKTLAAYYAGPGVVNKDGSINTEWKDLKNSAAPNVGQYIAQAKQRAGLTSAPAEVATPGRKPTYFEAQRNEAVQSKYQEESAKTEAEATRKEQEAFKASSDRGSVTRQIALADRFGKVLNKIGSDNRVVGLLNDPGIGNAVATLIRDGVNTPVGQLGMGNLEDALQLAIPGNTPQNVEARKELKQIMSEYALEASKIAQGQGAMSDYERRMFMDIAGSTSNTVDMLRRTQQALTARANFNDKARDLYDDMYVPGKPRDFQSFLASREYRTLDKEYRSQLLKINEGLEAKPGAQNAPKAPTSGTTSGGIKWKEVK